MGSESRRLPGLTRTQTYFKISTTLTLAHLPTEAQGSLTPWRALIEVSGITPTALRFFPGRPTSPWLRIAAASNFFDFSKKRQRSDTAARSRRMMAPPMATDTILNEPHFSTSEPPAPESDASPAQERPRIWTRRKSTLESLGTAPSCAKCPVAERISPT